MRAVVATLVSVGGTAMVFAVLLLMNGESEPPAVETTTRAVAMDVAPRPKPPRQKPRPKPRPKQTANRPAAPPPMPNLASGLSAVSLGVPQADVEIGGDGASQLLGNLTTSVMTEDSVDSKPRPVRRTPASYPPRARAKGVTGFVTMSLLIDERGNVERIKLLRAEPPGIFDAAAQAAVTSWQFDPAMYGEEPVKVWATQTIRFELR